MSVVELHERLLSWASADLQDPLLLAARRRHFERYGEPHEEDQSYERRMNGMLEYYLYDDRPSPGAPTALERFLAEQSAALDPEQVAAFRAMGACRHGLFEVTSLAAGTVGVKDVFTGQAFQVTERRQVAGLAKGDLFEARLVPYGGELWFTAGFLYHPAEARDRILAEVKRAKRAAGKSGRPDVTGFLAALSRMAFKLERYRNVRLESIYDFSGDGRASRPAGSLGGA
jgi:hypothetical protein